MSETTTGFPCSGCGADLKFQPGTSFLVCPYCGAENTIEHEKTEVRENDYHGKLQELKAEAESCGILEILTAGCESCGAEVTLEENQTAGECPFCGSHLSAREKSVKELKPEYLLPFGVDKQEASSSFMTWLRSRRFAPNKFKKHARHMGLKGIYSPYWTYDAASSTEYRGEKGVYYYTTESYTTTENGKSVTKTRSVRRTRWHSASGNVSNSFDDILIPAAENLPREYMEELEPWDLENLVAYREEFLSGFQVESYALGLEGGFERAKERMQDEIDESIEKDIGGDDQRIFSKDSSYEDIRFKHLLLPVWISAYRYKDKVYRFMVNARTGEVQGDRPYSKIKIALYIIFVVIPSVCLFFGCIFFAINFIEHL